MLKIFKWEHLGCTHQKMFHLNQEIKGQTLQMLTHCFKVRINSRLISTVQQTQHTNYKTRLYSIKHEQHSLVPRSITPSISFPSEVLNIQDLQNILYSHILKCATIKILDSERTWYGNVLTKQSRKVWRPVPSPTEDRMPNPTQQAHQKNFFSIYRTY